MSYNTNNRVKSSSIPPKEKSPKAISYKDNDEFPKWRFQLLDNDGPFSIYLYSVQEIKFVVSKLAEFEKISWPKIKIQTHDHRGSNHYISISEMKKPAYTRWKELCRQDETYEQYADNIFSIKLGNKKRVLGLLSGSVYFFLWYDDGHGVSKVTK